MAKTVFITGASSGFGKASAKLFQQKGWNVVATMRNPATGTELTGSPNLLLAALDVQDPTSITRSVQQAVDRFGSIDVLVNNAGYGLIGVFESASNEEIRQQFAVNVFGLMDVTRAILPHMRRQKGGTIINISSVGGMVGLPFGSFYNSSKFAVEGFSEALSHEVSPFHITVKIIEPGGVDTNFRNSIRMIKNEIPEYDPFAGALVQRYLQTTAHLTKATAEDVAATIYQAATDNAARLRYVVGADAQFYIDTKLKNKDEVFVQKIRGYFL